MYRSRHRDPEEFLEASCVCGAEMNGRTEQEILDWYRRHAEVCAAMAKKLTESMAKLSQEMEKESKK